MIIDINRGKRLLLRRSDEQDFDFVWAASQDHEFVATCLPDIIEGFTEEQLKNSLIALKNQVVTETIQLFFTIEHVEKGAIGIAILGDYTPVHRRCEQILAIPLLEHRHQGYGIEAALLLLDLAFNHYQLAKVYGHAYDYNPEGHALAVRCGFSDEGVMRQHVYLTRYQRYGDLHVHGLLETEFRSNAILAKLSARWLGRDITLIQQHA